MVAFIMRYPWFFALGGTAFFLAFLVVFFTRVKFANQGIGNTALWSPIRHQYNLIMSRFPKSDSAQSSADVWIQTREANGIRSPAFVTALDAFSKLVAKVPNVVSVTSLTTLDASTSLATYISVYGDPFNSANIAFTSKMMHPFGLTDFDRITRASVSLSVAASSNELGATVRGVRAALDESFFDANGVKMLDRWGVSGDAPSQYDSNVDILGTIPNAIAVIVCAMYVLILLLTGSLVVPIKSIVCAALSVCAAFGILVQVVQEGNGSDFLKFENNYACLDPLQM